MLRLYGAAQYKMDFLIGITGLLVQQLIILLLLLTIFTNISSLGGLSLVEILFMIGLGQFVRGLDTLYNDYIWVEAFGGFSEGSLYHYFTKPLPIYFQILMNRVNTESVGPIAIGLLLLVYSTNSMEYSFSFIDFIMVIYFILIGLVMLFSIKLIVASVSLWWGRSGELMQIVHEFIEFTKYPVSIYGWLLQSVLLIILPFGLIAYLPTLYFVGETDIPILSIFIPNLSSESMRLAIAGYVTAIAMVQFSLAQVVWRIGLKKTSVTGT